ncbi:MAG: hypothetical protein LC687_00135 [Actinobacteria bacterium]|nr:hypothetical protein [Actinomycetota bacterium]MCA1806278.1 hypothetical protein [Actinomycetota bacterium]
MANNSKAAATPLLSIVKNVSFVVLSVISISLSVYLFIQFSSYPVESILFGLLAIAFEGSKLYALVDGHADWLSKRFKPAIIKYGMYTLLALLSVVASYGFSLGALQRAELDPATSRTAYQEQALERQIQEIDGQISNFQDQQSRLGDGWVTAAQRLQESIDSLVERRTELYDDLYSLEQPDFDLASNAFILIGRSVGISGELVMFVLLIILSFSIELCIIFTSPSIPHPTKKKYTYKKKPGPKPQTNSTPKKKPGPKSKPKEVPVEEKKEEPEPSVAKKKSPAELINYKAPAPVTPKDIPARPSKEDKKMQVLTEALEGYVHNLFDNGENTYLKEAPSAAADLVNTHKEAFEAMGFTEEDLKLFAKKLWSKMINTKGPTGYLLVEPDDADSKNPKFLPNYTSELIINVLRKKIVDTSKGNSPDTKG